MELESSDIWIKLAAVGTFLGGTAAIITAFARHGVLRWIAVIFGIIVGMGSSAVVITFSCVGLPLAVGMLSESAGIRPTSSANIAMLGAGFVFGVMLSYVLYFTAMQLVKDVNEVRYSVAVFLVAIYYAAGIGVLVFSRGELSTAWIPMLVAPAVSFIASAIAGLAIFVPSQQRS